MEQENFTNSQSVYAYLEDKKDRFQFDETLQYLIDYCQECISDERLTKYPNEIVIDTKHRQVKFLYESKTGEFIRITFREANTSDEIDIDISACKGDELLVKSNIGWVNALNYIQKW